MICDPFRRFAGKLLFFILAAAVMFFSTASADAKFSTKFSNGNEAFPSFGTGPVEVRLYANYFCGPCGALEPVVEPILHELVGEEKIRLVLVDVPMPQAIPYIHYFLYALNAAGGIDQAFTIRGILFDIAARRGSAEDIRNAFAEAQIEVEPFELTGVFVEFNELLREDAIRSTPTAVIHKDGGSESHTGSVAIIEALEALR